MKEKCFVEKVRHCMYKTYHMLMLRVLMLLLHDLKWEKKKRKTITVLVDFITPPSNSNHMTPSENFLKIWDFPLVFFISELNSFCSFALKSPTRTQTTHPRLKNLKWARGGGNKVNKNDNHAILEKTQNVLNHNLTNS